MEITDCDFKLGRPQERCSLRLHRTGGRDTIKRSAKQMSRAAQHKNHGRLRGSPIPLAVTRSRDAYLTAKRREEPGRSLCGGNGRSVLRG
jgi:hypothetical protein